METAGAFITENIASKICSTVFDTDTIEELKLTLGNGDIVPLYKQFYIYFKGYILKYDLEELIIRTATIFDYAKQEVQKFKFAKKQLDKLNDPFSFFNTNISDNDGSAVNVSINTTDTTNKGKNNTFNASRGNIVNIGSANAVGRAGASQLNEEYTGIEEHWRKEDSKYYQMKQETAKETLDINIPKDLEDIDLNTVLTTTDNLVLTKEPESEPETDIQAPEISYTGINLNKSVSSSSAKNTNTNKALNLNSTKSTNESNTVNSAVNTNNNKSTNINFVYGDATYKALGLYVSNFREAFFSSFSDLFVEPWTGYSI